MNDANPSVGRNTGADVGPQGEHDTKNGKRLFTTHFFRARKGPDVVFSQEPPPPPPKTVRRPARIARMLALAHRLQQAIDSGEIEDRATLARRFGITRARVTQLLNLTLLAPDIQEQVLALEAVDGLEPTSERALREVSRQMDWSEQQRVWAELQSRLPH
jgi:hypothetical protein